MRESVDKIESRTIVFATSAGMCPPVHLSCIDVNGLTPSDCQASKQRSSDRLSCVTALVNSSKLQLCQNKRREDKERKWWQASQWAPLFNQSVLHLESWCAPRQKRWILKKQLMIMWRAWQSEFINHTSSALTWQKTNKFLRVQGRTCTCTLGGLVKNGGHGMSVYVAAECVPLLIIKPDVSIWYHPDATKFTTATMGKAM